MIRHGRPQDVSRAITIGEHYLRAHALNDETEESWTFFSRLYDHWVERHTTSLTDSPSYADKVITYDKKETPVATY